MNARLINQDSGRVEFYTPAYIVDAARDVMGGIDLDPASCSKANKNVQATRFFSQRENGLSKNWHGRVWMNHPFSKKHNSDWIKKLVAEFNCGHIKEAICICFCSSSERWFRPLLDFPQCFLHKRVNYIDHGGVVMKGVTKGSVVTYLGSNTERFRDVFESLGTIKVKYVPSKEA
jgi:hypothetical protein